MAYKRMTQPRIDAHSNGIVIKWDDVHETSQPGQTYANTNYKEQSEVYKLDHDADDGGEDFNKGMDRYKELMKKYAGEKKAGK